MGVITAQEFKNKATRVINITGFEEGEKIQIRIKPLSIMSMMSSGKLPNELLVEVQKMFNLASSGKDIEFQDNGTDDLVYLTQLFDIACKECMVEPTFAEVGEFLTDTQKDEIFTTATDTVQKATPSIPKPGNIGCDSDC